MLSWGSGQTPIAVVRGSRAGRQDGKILYLSDKMSAPPGAFVDLELTDGQLQPYPIPTQRNVALCCGQSGSGKSTWTSNFVAEWAVQHPKRPIFIISRVATDEAFDGIPNIERILADRFLDEPLSSDNFPNDCLVLFDDTDTYPDQKIKLAVQNLRNDLLETGRHGAKHVFLTAHNLISGHQSKTYLNETHWITVFPKGGSLNQLRYLLKAYLGFDKNEIAHLIRLPSRWVSIYRNYPGAVVYSTGAYTSEGGANKKKSMLL